MKLYAGAEIESRGIAADEIESFGQPWYIMSYKNGVVGLHSGGKVIGSVPSGLPGFKMPRFEWSAMMHAWQTNRHDGIVAVVAFVFTLALAPELEMGILFGMLLSLVLLLFRIMKPRVAFPPHRAHILPPEAVTAGAIDDGRIVRMRRGTRCCVTISSASRSRALMYSSPA